MEEGDGSKGGGEVREEWESVIGEGRERGGGGRRGEGRLYQMI